MGRNTYGKDFFVSIFKDLAIICKSPTTHLITLEDMEDMRKRYLYEEGQEILTPFGIQTIKKIIYDYGTQHGYEWLILVEENGNQYKPVELIGIVHKVVSLAKFNDL